MSSSSTGIFDISTNLFILKLSRLSSINFRSSLNLSQKQSTIPNPTKSFSKIEKSNPILYIGGSPGNRPKKTFVLLTPIRLPLSQPTLLFSIFDSRQYLQSTGQYIIVQPPLLSSRLYFLGCLSIPCSDSYNVEQCSNYNHSTYQYSYCSSSKY